MASRRIGSFLINPGNSNATQFITTLNDGSGSGFDADLLDGQHGSYYAPKASPAFTGTPTAPTASAGTNTTQLATTAFVSTAVSNLVDSAPGTLDTLNELAAALGDDSNFSTTVTNSIATKLSLSGGTMTGNIAFSGAQTVDGRDLSADGSKLDGIAAGAEVNVQSDWNATSGDALILNKPTIPTNNNQLTNGAGYITSSGSITGSAGTLDGLDSTQFLRSDANDSTSGQITFTKANNTAAGASQIYLNGATGNRIDWSQTGVAAPSFTTRSVGTKLALYPFVSATNVDYALGIESNTLWYSVPTTSNIHRWYGGTTEMMKLTNSVLTVGGNTVWNAGNDGAGSGLDADLLDGQQGSYYLNYNNLSNKPTIPTNNNQLTNGAGYITSSGSITGSAGTLDGLDSTQFLRSDAADTATGTITFDSGANVVINSNIGANSTTAFASMTGRLEFDTDYSDTARGANKILLFYDGNAWMAGFGVHNSTVSYYSGADHAWYKSNSSTSFTERMRLSSAGLLTVGGNTVWNAGNDGSGSGLDADLLDGQQGSYYLNYNNLSNKPTIPTNNNQLTNGAGYITSSGSITGSAGTLDGLDSTQFLRSDADDIHTGRLAVGNFIGSISPGFSVVGDADSSPIVAKTSNINTTFAILPYSSGITYVSSGIYYDDGGWVHASDNANNCLLALSGSGTNWYASNNSTGSWNVASNVSLWTSQGYWNNRLSTSVTYNGNTIWHAGNDGAGSGLDADLLDGQNLVNNAATANTVAGRDASGDIYARLIRQTFADQSTINGGMVFRTNSSSDNYLRVCNSTSAIRAYLNVPTRTGGDASGTWGINITGNAATAANAGTLDGLDSTQFLRSDADDSTSGYLQAEGFVGSGGILRIANPGGASSPAGPASSTGYLKITLPVSWTDTMMRMTIRVYEYASGESFDVHCGGYNYSGNTSWYNTFAYILNDPSFTGGRNFNVRFGHDGTKCAIYIGESNSTWSYVNFAVTEFLAGHSNYTAASWHNGWSCSVTTTLGTITSTESNVQVGKWVDGNVTWHAGNDGAGSGLDADLLDGLQPSVSASNNTIVQRHSSGYIYANYFNTTPNDVTSGVTKVCVETGNDGFIRHGTAAAIRTFIGAGSGGGLDADLLDGQQGSYYLDYNNFTNTPASAAAPNNGTLTLNVSGGGLSGSASFTANQSGNSTFTVTSNATSANTASTIVARDGSGNFSAGTITAALSGNAATATNISGYSGTYWTSNNDGAGSGLDADLLDGLSSGSFFRADASNGVDCRLTAGDGRGLRFWDSDSYKIWMSHSGNATWGGRLDSTSDYNMYFRMTGGTNRGFVFKNSTTNVFQIESNGQVRLASNNIYAGNANIVWHAGNDGAGSGLDADLLDGISSASFLRGDVDDTFTRLSGTRVSCGYDSGNDNSVGCSNWFRSSGATGWYNATYGGGWYMQDTTWIRNFSNKSVYLNTGTLRTDGTLQVGNNGATFNAPSGGTVTISGSTAWHAGNDGSGSGLDADLLDGLNAATTGANTIVRTDASGNIAASGNVTAYSSDRRLKENFNHIESPVEKVQKLNGYTFDWNEKSKELGFTPKHEKNDIGLIAQEVEDILPQAVAPAPFDTKSNGESKSGENYLTIQYERLVPLLVEAIKEQQNQINKLTQEIEQLKK